MKAVGLTGGIGAGKSLVARIFSTLGVPIYDADAAGRRLLDEDDIVRAEVSRLLGEDAYKDGLADRPHIASMVFSDAKLLMGLNDIIHPQVKRDFELWMQSKHKQAYGIYEAAILHESGSYKTCSAVICVSAPDEVRIDRAMKRDAVGRSQIIARMERQLPQEEKEKLSDFILINDGKSAVIPQVMTIHQALISMP